MTPEVKRVFLRAVPGMRPVALQRSLARFSGPAYALSRRSAALDLAIATLATPFVCARLLLRSRRRRPPAARVDVLIDAVDEATYVGHHRAVHAHLADLVVARSGHGFEVPPPAERYDLDIAWRGAWGLLLALPRAVATSVTSGHNVVNALARTAVVYARMRSHARAYPCRAWFTHADNACSPAVRAALHAEGAKLFAYQNGVRFPDEGIDHAEFDHLFPLGDAWTSLYRRLEGIVERSTPVGSIRVGAPPDPPRVRERDVLFVDQGPPSAGAAHWGVTGPEAARRYLGQVRRFALANPDLRVGYLLRRYGSVQARLERDVRAALEGAPLTILPGRGPAAALDACAASGVVVTMSSTLGLEALALGTPTLFVDHTGDPAHHVTEPPLQLACPDDDALARAIRETLAGRLRAPPATVESFIWRDPRSAAEAIAQAIRSDLSHA